MNEETHLNPQIPKPQNPRPKTPDRKSSKSGQAPMKKGLQELRVQSLKPLTLNLKP